LHYKVDCITLHSTKHHFSLGGKTISSARSALKLMIVQALVCLQDWRHAEYDTTPMVDDDSNSEEEGADEDEDDDTSLFLPAFAHHP